MPAIRVIDSSLLIESDHRKLLGALEDYLRHGPASLAPPRVLAESVTEPKSIGFEDSANRIERLFAGGALKVEEPDYSGSQVSSVVDKVRRCIASKAGKPEHLVERADLQVVALAVSHAKRGDPVEIIFRDKLLKDCLEAVLRGQGITGISVADFPALIQRLKEKPKGRAAAGR